jgi:hypothetical protein
VDAGELGALEHQRVDRRVGCKVWETIDEPRLLVIGRYRMSFGVEPLGTGSCFRIWIVAGRARRVGLRRT